MRMVRAPCAAPPECCLEGEIAVLLHSPAVRALASLMPAPLVRSLLFASLLGGPIQQCRSSTGAFTAGAARCPHLWAIRAVSCTSAPCPETARGMLRRAWIYEVCGKKNGSVEFFQRLISEGEGGENPEVFSRMVTQAPGCWYHLPRVHSSPPRAVPYQQWLLMFHVLRI